MDAGVVWISLESTFWNSSLDSQIPPTVPLTQRLVTNRSTHAWGHDDANSRHPQIILATIMLHPRLCWAALFWAPTERRNCEGQARHLSLTMKSLNKKTSVSNFSLSLYRRIAHIAPTKSHYGEHVVSLRNYRHASTFFSTKIHASTLKMLSNMIRNPITRAKIPRVSQTMAMWVFATM